MYEQFANKLKNIKEQNKESEQEAPNFYSSSEIDDKLKDVIFTLSAFPLNLEICGSWLWVTGRTWLYSKQLKACGCIFCSRKKAWCFHSEEWKKRKHKLTLYEIRITLDEIRNLHGSVKVSNTQTKQIKV